MIVFKWRTVTTILLSCPSFRGFSQSLDSLDTDAASALADTPELHHLKAQDSTLHAFGSVKQAYAYVTWCQAGSITTLVLLAKQLIKRIESIGSMETLSEMYDGLLKFR